MNSSVATAIPLDAGPRRGKDLVTHQKRVVCRIYEGLEQL